MPDSLYMRCFRASPLPMAIEDASHRLVDVNDAFCGALRASADELLGIDLAQLIPASTRTMAGRGAPDAAGEATCDIGPTRIHEMTRGDGTSGRFWLSKTLNAGWEGGTWILWTLIELPELSVGSDEAGGRTSLHQGDLLDVLSIPVAVLDQDRAIVALSAGLRTVLGQRSRLGGSLGSVGGPSWQRLDAALARLGRADGPQRLAFDLTWRDERPARVAVVADLLIAGNGARRWVLTLTEPHAMEEARQHRMDAAVGQARADTSRQVADALVGLAGLMMLRTSDHPHAARESIDASSRILTMSAVHAMQARMPGRIALRALVQAIVTNHAHLHGTSIPLSPREPAAGVAAEPLPTLREQDAMVVALAIDELVANALEHGPPGAPLATRLLVTPDYALFHIQSESARRAHEDDVAIEPDTVGLGTIKALLPAGGRVMLVHVGKHIVASMLLRPPLLRYD